MLLRELFELVPKEEDSGVIRNNMGRRDDRRGDVQWAKDTEQSARVWVLKDRAGKTITKPLTSSEVKVMANRPDIIKRFGKVFPVQISTR